MQTEEWPAPTRGWVQSGNRVTAPKDAAERLDNWFPTSQGVRLRRGSSQYADLGAAVKRLVSYETATPKMFGATASAVFDAGRVNGDSDNTWAEWEGQVSGDWSATQTSTSGGQFVVAVNGSDHAWYFDGTNIQPIHDETIIDLPFDAETAAFAVGQTVTGGTSGATAEIIGIAKTSATAGALKTGAITGTFQDNETITDGASGSATANIPSGTSTASTVTITNVATADLSQVWLFKERLFFVEGGTQSAWYLPAESIGGAASELNLGSIFRKGGNLLFGATWSLDSGSGLDDVCIFVSTEGEIAVYEGSDPASASTWALVGVYDVGEPIDKHAFFKTGGDLAIMTKDGIVPVSAALRQDRAALQTQAITFPIEDAWQAAIADVSSAFPITATLWQSNTQLLIGVPTTDGGRSLAFVANARTGAWCRYIGWDVRCSVVSDDQLYFGSNDGKIYTAETGGDDEGQAYTGVCVPKFSSRGAAKKFLTRALVIGRSPEAPTLRIRGLKDYQIPDFGAPPTTSPPQTSSVWGTGVWGTSTWGGNVDPEPFSQWSKVNGSGYAVSVAVLCTSNDTLAADVELSRFMLRYEAGSPL